MPAKFEDPAQPRFEAFAAPESGFVVFDVEQGHPADIDGHVLIGLAEVDAHFIADILNAGGQPSQPYLQALGLPRG